MKKIALRLGSVVVLGFAQTAYTQDNSSEDLANDKLIESLEEVVVTGSRVITNGFQAPTPMTVVSTDDLKKTNPDLTQALRELPQLSGTSSPQSVQPTTSGGPSTGSSANLRDLGPQRTLVLLDGRRAAPSLMTGASDMSFFPRALVERIEVVTGGASAAYGSDAVAGVVNFVLDTDYEGMFVEARGGVSQENDAGLYGFEIAGGTSFADGDGHVVFSLDARHQDGLDGTERSYSTAHTNIVDNPNAGPGEPTDLLADNVSYSRATFGGLILDQGPLYGTMFDDAGNPQPFNVGSPAGVNGDGAAYEEPLLAKSDKKNIFAHAKYKLTDDLEMYLEGSYGQSDVGYPLAIPFHIFGPTPYAIQADNAYLPQSIRDIMVANDIDSFRLRKVDRDYGRSYFSTETDQLNLALGFDATLPGDFMLEGYYTHAETELKYANEGDFRMAESRNASDAVVNPANGEIVCRSTLSNPGDGCVPIDVFGYNPLSDAAREYIGIGSSWAKSKAEQNVAALTLSGDIFSTWAGPVAAAFGVEYRDISTDVTVDELSKAGAWGLNNYGEASGSYDVTELFTEMLFPLAEDLPLAQELSLNVAFRYTDYSTSGGVNSWKFGLTDEMFDGFRVRAAFSRDIRAPNISELFGGQSTTVVTNLTDPENPGQNPDVVWTDRGSNPDLKPELSDTTTVGFIYQPSQISGLGLSVDYYKLEIEDAIDQLSEQTIVDQCYAGVQSLCGLVTRDSNNEIIRMAANRQNVTSAEISGLDFEINYSTPFMKGELSMRALANYLKTYKFITPGANTYEEAGYMWKPKWRGNLFVTYAQGPLSVTVSERYLGTSYRDDQPVLVDDAKTDPAFYTNLSVNYELDMSSTNASVELFANVANLFNEEPQGMDMNGVVVGWNAWSAAGYYDPIGRYYTAGVRVRY